MNKETDQLYHRHLIYQEFLKVLDSLNTKTLTKAMIKKHRKFINQFDLKGKAQYKTYDLLNSYYNSKHKDTTLTCINNFGYKKIFNTIK